MSVLDRSRALFADLLEFLRVTDEDGLISGTNVGYFSALVLYILAPGQWTLAGLTLMVAHYAGKKLIKRRDVAPLSEAVEGEIGAITATLNAHTTALDGLKREVAGIHTAATINSLRR